MEYRYNHPIGVRRARYLPFLNVDVQFDVQALAVHLQLPLALSALVAADRVVGLAAHVADEVPVVVRSVVRLPATHGVVARRRLRSSLGAGLCHLLRQAFLELLDLDLVAQCLIRVEGELEHG